MLRYDTNNETFKNLDMSVRIDLVYSFAGSPASLAVEIETLDKNAVVTQTSDPDVTLTIQTQLNSLANVQPSSTRPPACISRINFSCSNKEK